MRFSFGLIAFNAASVTALGSAGDVTIALNQITDDIVNGIQKIVLIATNITSNNAGAGVVLSTEPVLSAVTYVVATQTDLIDILLAKQNVFVGLPLIDNLTNTAFVALNSVLANTLNTVTNSVNGAGSSTAAVNLVSNLQDLIAKLLKVSSAKMN